MNQVIETAVGPVPVHGRWIKSVYRTLPDLSVVLTEREVVENLIVNTGLNFLAARIGSQTVGTNSAMYYMAVGTVTTAATYTNATLTGEVARKAYTVNTLNANLWSVVATWAGSLDSVTSVTLAEAGTWNAPGSAQGILFQRVTFSQTTLANSDFLTLQIDTTVGSHA